MTLPKAPRRIPVTAADRHAKPIDAVTVLSIYVIVMMTVPSPARFPPAGSIGAPATLMAIMIFFWWLWEQAHRSSAGPAGPQRVRRGAIVLLVTILAVYGVASMRPLPQDEIMPAQSGLLQFLALAGVTLTASDGVADRERLDVLVRRIVLAGGFLGVLAMIQFFTNQLWVDRFLPPFLSMDARVLVDRGAFTRPSATATHPLEFGTVTAMIIPLAVARARAVTRGKVRWWFCAGVIVLGGMMTISRSAVIGTALGLLVLIWPWPWRDKLRAAGTAVLGLGLVVIAVPGLVGTLRGLFLGASEDPSVQSRTDSYPYVVEMVGRFPLFGKGYGTFLPRYWILDNGFLNFLLSAGVLGICAFLALLGAAFYSARSAARQSQDPRHRETSQALLAASIAGASSVAFFDIFAFPQAAGLLFLLLGLCGAAYRFRLDVTALEDGSNVVHLDDSHRNHGEIGNQGS